ncbi:hypothetical protein Tcan_01849 [Toxocara canis]|uniref:Uncharacterized protein n=1 Tax=Toxocara canis TaxID=6265 RepID=A0A0B2VNG2_TOXCA|nr:hypothetical protein Tcan_01849 [Toxocara canis]
MKEKRASAARVMTVIAPRGASEVRNRLVVAWVGCTGDDLVQFTTMWCSDTAVACCPQLAQPNEVVITKPQGERSDVLQLTARPHF